MSEEQKSVMGPRRLFILLALGAVVFYFLSSGDTKAESVEDTLSENLDTTDPVEVDNLEAVDEVVIDKNNNTYDIVKTAPKTSTNNLY